MNCSGLFFLCIFFIATLTFAQRPIGVNLAAFTDWSSEFVFKDAFPMCREWTQINVANSATIPGLVIPLREDGYPLSLPFDGGGGIQLGLRTFVFTGQIHSLPEGVYTLISSGNGVIRIQQSGGSGHQTLVSPGILSFAKQSNGHFIIDILESDPTDPVRDIRFVMPGFIDTYETEPFHPDFLDFAANFQCIRFMNWMRTNGSTIVEWSQRTPEDYYSYTLPFYGHISHRGVAYERMADLCNTLETDAWVNIPHMASDDFIEQFALFLKERLHDGLKIYVEFSNELWNTAAPFPQSVWAGIQGQMMGYPPPVENQRRLFTAKRSADVFRIFEEVFGEENPRLVKVLAGQAGNSQVAAVVVGAFLNNLHNVNPTGTGVDALAIAPYFGNFITNASSVDNALDQAQNAMETLAFMRIDAHLDLLTNNNWDLPLIAYEGGQHLDGPNQTIDDLFCQANRHERMGELYCDYFNYWYQQGGGLFVHYNSISYCNSSGSWGLKEYTGQADVEAPKFRAILDCVINEAKDIPLTDRTRPDEFHIYPNPTDGVFLVRDARFELAKVWNVQGRVVHTSSCIADGLINLSALPAGLYFLTLERDNKIFGWAKIVRK